MLEKDCRPAKPLITRTPSAVVIAIRHTADAIGGAGGGRLCDLAWRQLGATRPISVKCRHWPAAACAALFAWMFTGLRQFMALKSVALVIVALMAMLTRVFLQF